MKECLRNASDEWKIAELLNLAVRVILLLRIKHTCHSQRQLRPSKR